MDKINILDFKKKEKKNCIVGGVPWSDLQISKKMETWTGTGNGATDTSES